ncbi:MAG: serine/threonine protein kinase, partial [Planctomycetes bacterium]|nr:serine/threonine protein kinase [Planctomycetota bacterium]
MSLPAPLEAALAERFTWIASLGEGAHGWVELVEERSMGRRVALKVGKHRGDPERLARFEREGRVAASLRHPNLVSVHSTGAVEGHPFLVLDYVEGAQTLREALRGLPLQRQLRALLDVTRGVAHAHTKQVVHRDLKPENVLVGPGGVARVTDFGSATFLGAERLTQTGGLVGTPSYMAPEQIAGDRGLLGPHTDVWALGVLLHEVACGRLPFAGATLLQLAAEISAGVGRVEVLRGVPPALANVIAGCLRADPQARYPHAGALERALAAALEGETPDTPRAARGRAGALAGAFALLVVAVAVV